MRLLQLAQVNKSSLARATKLEQRAILYAYHPDYVYGLKFTELNFANIGEPSLEMFRLLDKLLERSLTGTAARRAVLDHAAREGELIKLICNKHMQAGFSSTTVRKYLPGLLPAPFSVQLAKEVPVQKLRFPLAAELKYDGVRLLVLKHNGKVTFKTRNAKEVVLPNIARLLDCIPDNLVIDTEVTLASGKQEDRTKVSGMINSAIRGGSIDETLLMFNMFDLLSFDDFNSQAKTKPFLKRRARLMAFSKTLERSEAKDNFRLAPMVLVADPDQVRLMYAKALAEGYEGIVLKTLDHPYSFKRTQDWAKLKETKTADLKCVDVKEGTNKYEGSIGALICQGSVEGVNVTVSVGSGLTDYERGLPASFYLGKTIEVNYNAVIDNSLFLPRFVTVREDK